MPRTSMLLVGPVSTPSITSDNFFPFFLFEDIKKDWRSEGFPSKDLSFSDFKDFKCIVYIRSGGSREWQPIMIFVIKKLQSVFMEIFHY